jgi:muramoyltetrapeptide carboxypeptidase
MRIPSPLNPGSCIGICAPARKVSAEELAAGISLLESWGLRVKFPKFLYGAFHQFSGTDEQRAADLQELIDDPEVDAIICARGGYGCVRIVDRIDFSPLMNKPKWIIGFSDVTVLHNHLQQQCNIASLHAPMVYSMDAGRTTPEALESLRRVLFGEARPFNCNPHSLNRPGTARGILTGGNLSLLYALSGSVSEADTAGKILFLEDLDEYLYHIDRMMMQLKRSGKLANLAGLIIGGMSDMKDNTVPFGYRAEEIIAEAVSEYRYPVCMGFPAGHISNNHALLFGATYQLHVGQQVLLELVQEHTA